MFVVLSLSCFLPPEKNNPTGKRGMPHQLIKGESTGIPPRPQTHEEGVQCRVFDACGRDTFSLLSGTVSHRPAQCGAGFECKSSNCGGFHHQCVKKEKKKCERLRLLLLLRLMMVLMRGLLGHRRVGTCAVGGAVRGGSVVHRARLTDTTAAAAAPDRRWYLRTRRARGPDTRGKTERERKGVRQMLPSPSLPFKRRVV